MNQKPNQEKPTDRSVQEQVEYEAPAIVYETQITSRAGSPIPGAPTAPDQKQEINLFPED